MTSMPKDIVRTMEQILDRENDDISLRSLASETLRAVGGKPHREEADLRRFEEVGRRLFKRRCAARQLTFDFRREV